MFHLRHFKFIFAFLLLFPFNALALTSTITWNDNSTNEDGFKIERSRKGIGIFAEIGTTAKDVTTYVDVTPGRESYCYRVRAFNDSGESDPSNVACKLIVLASALEDELQNDPLGRGYSAMTDEQIRDDGHIEYRTLNLTNMSGRAVAAEVVASEYNALSAVKKAQFLALIASDSLDPFGLAVTVVKDIFGAGSVTVSNLAAARVETVSRWRELDINPKIGEIEDARP